MASCDEANLTCKQASITSEQRKGPFNSRMNPKFSGCRVDAFHLCAVRLVLTRPPLHCDCHQQFEAAGKRQFEKMPFPETHKITSSSTGCDKGSEDFMLVTF